MKNFKKGSLSIDFLFSFSAVVLLLLFFIMTALTFSLVEVSQYISYAAARAYFVGRENYEEQHEAARSKYNELNTAFFKPGRGGLSEWFKLTEEPSIGIPPSEINERHYHFFGVSFEFGSKVLIMDIPLLGDSEDSDSNESFGFAFPIGTYLGREPNQYDCHKFNERRWNDNVSTGGGVPSGYSQGGNGC